MHEPDETNEADEAKRDEARRHTHESEVRPDTPETMQQDHEDAPGRQRYADPRASDYGHEFREDGSGEHPVKPADEQSLDEDGIPKIAETEPSGGKGKRGEE